MGDSDLLQLQFQKTLTHQGVRSKKWRDKLTSSVPQKIMQHHRVLLSNIYNYIYVIFTCFYQNNHPGAKVRVVTREARY